MCILNNIHFAKFKVPHRDAKIKY